MSDACKWVCHWCSHRWNYGTGKLCPKCHRFQPNKKKERTDE